MSPLSPPPGRAEFDRQLCEILPDMRALALSQLRHGPDADDLVSRTMTRMLNKWRLFEPGTNFKAWAFRCMFNERMAEFRRLKNRETSFDARPILIRNATVPGGQESELGLSRIFEAVKEMRPDHRELLERIVFDEQSYEAAASALGLSVGTVKSRLWRARISLQRMIDGTAYEALSSAQRRWLAQADQQQIIYCQSDKAFERATHERIAHSLLRRGFVYPAGVLKYHVTDAGRRALLSEPMEPVG